MHPTIDLIFFDLPVYTALVMLGAVVGVFAAYIFLRARSRHAATLSVFVNGTLVLFIAGWLGARAYHVAVNWDYYAARPDEIAQVGLGGMAMRGGLIAGLIALPIFARVYQLRLGVLLDAAAFGLSIGQAIGWAGAFAWGANYGVVSDSPLAMDLPDLYGLTALRFPLQLVEIILFAGLFVILGLLALRKPQPGTLFVAYLLIASAANFALGFVRGDETRYLGTLRVDQWVDAAPFILATAQMFYFVIPRKDRSDTSERT